MKYEWRKQDKALYIPTNTPTILTIPAMSYIWIQGEGNPNSEQFSSCVQALYAIAYGIKMNLKKTNDFPDYVDYTVFPLEGEWNLTQEGIERAKKGQSILELKDYFHFTIMIRQPDFVTESYYKQIQEMVFKKKNNETILQVQYSTFTEGLVCQMLHQGSYDTEPLSFQKMEDYCLKHGYQRLSKKHKEIYLSDPSKVESSKLKTTLRFAVSKR